MRKLYLNFAVLLSALSFLLVFSTQLFDRRENITANICYNSSYDVVDCNSSDAVYDSSYMFSTDDTSIVDDSLGVVGTETTDTLTTGAIVTDDASTTDMSSDNISTSDIISTAGTTSIDDLIIDASSVDVSTIDTTQETKVGTEDYVKCPFYKKENRIILDFTKGGSIPVEDLTISANRDFGSDVHSFSGFHISPGIYKISLASYHDINHDLYHDTNELYGQTWYLLLYDDSGNKILSTRNTRSISNDESYIKEIVEDDIKVDDLADIAIAKHASYPSDNAYSFAPLCASFDLLQEIQKSGTDDNAIMRANELELEQKDDVSEDTNSTETSHDIFSSHKDITNSVRTKTTVINSDSQPEMPKIAFGEKGHLTHNEIIGKRREIKQKIGDDLFEKLAYSGQDEREKIIKEDIKNILIATGTDEISNKIVVDRIVADEKRDVNSESRLGMYILKNRKKVSKEKTDSDGDGIIDYDEIYIYGTDPNNAFTSQSVFSDGERVLMGFDPLKNDIKTIPVESPQKNKNVAEDLFKIEKIELIKNGGDIKTEKDKIKIDGTAPPLSFVTLFVYSTPIVVTVRADESGRFEYTLDKTLQDGKHEVYVANVNNSGKILARSDAISFVKTAEAIDYVPVSVSPTTNPVNSAMQNILILAFLFILILSFGIIIWLGMLKTQHDEHNESTLGS